jgi:uncharacterized protein
MLFRRRTPLSKVEKLRVAVWPRESWSRSLKYFGKRVLRLSASPHAIGLGFAAGVMVSWTPFVGFHFLMSAFIALILGGNLIASTIGTVIGNPFTFPLLWWSSYSLGHWLLYHGPSHGRPPPIHLGFGTAAWEEIVPVLKPMLVGAVPLGLVSGLIAYVIVRFMVTAYQTARRQRLATRRQVDAQSGASDS